MANNGTNSIQRIADLVAHEIVAAKHGQDASFIKTPVLYPGGSSVVVQISKVPSGFYVSDYAHGYDEADQIGAANIYSRTAVPVAENAGVQFINHAMCVKGISREQLPGAVIAIANCSQEAVAVTTHKIGERKAADDADALYRRLLTIFSPSEVVKDAEVPGASTTLWHVTSMVHTGHHRAVFDFVSSHHASIFAASTKFQDIKRLEHPPTRVAVVNKKSELRTYEAVLSQSANVIERDVSNRQIEKLAKMNGYAVEA